MPQSRPAEPATASSCSLEPGRWSSGCSPGCPATGASTPSSTVSQTSSPPCLNRHDLHHRTAARLTRNPASTVGLVRGQVLTPLDQGQRLSCGCFDQHLRMGVDAFWCAPGSGPKLFLPASTSCRTGGSWKDNSPKSFVLSCCDQTKHFSFQLFSVESEVYVHQP